MDRREFAWFNYAEGECSFIDRRNPLIASDVRRMDLDSTRAAKHLPMGTPCRSTERGRPSTGVRSNSTVFGRCDCDAASM